MSFIIWRFFSNPPPTSIRHSPNQHICKLTYDDTWHIHKAYLFWSCRVRAWKHESTRALCVSFSWGISPPLCYGSHETLCVFVCELGMIIKITKVNRGTWQNDEGLMRRFNKMSCWKYENPQEKSSPTQSCVTFYCSVALWMDYGWRYKLYHRSSLRMTTFIASQRSEKLSNASHSCINNGDVYCRFQH